MTVASSGLERYPPSSGLQRKFGIELELGRLSAGSDSAAVRQQIRAAVFRYGFVVLRDQRFTDTALLTMGRQFGAIEDRVIKYSTMGPSATQDATRWHHHSNCNGRLDDWLLYYTPAVPDTGGSIEFFDAVSWFGLLCDADRHWARRQQVRHDFSSVAHAGIPPVAEPAWHPMVAARRFLQETQEMLYMGAHAVDLADGRIADAAKDSPLGRMRELAATPALYHLHEARPHDLIMWDLKAVAHRGHPWRDESLRAIHEVVVREIAE